MKSRNASQSLYIPGTRLAVVHLGHDPIYICDVVFMGVYYAYIKYVRRGQSSQVVWRALIPSIYIFASFASFYTACLALTDNFRPPFQSWNDREGQKLSVKLHCSVLGLCMTGSKSLALAVEHITGACRYLIWAPTFPWITSRPTCDSFVLHLCLLIQI